MTLKGAIEREARQGKLINHTRRRGRRRRGCLSGRIVFKRCNLVLILADGKTARRESTTLQFQGDAREQPTDRPTDLSLRSWRLCSARRELPPAGALVICIQSWRHVHVHARTRARVKPRPTKEIIAKGTESYLAKIVCFQRTEYSRGGGGGGSSAERSAYV